MLDVLSWKIFGPPFRPQKIIRAPFAMKITGQAHRIACKLKFHWKFVFFSPPPLQGSEISRAPLLHQAPLTIVCERSLKVAVNRKTYKVWAYGGWTSGGQRAQGQSRAPLPSGFALTFVCHRLGFVLFMVKAASVSRSPKAQGTSTLARESLPKAHQWLQVDSVVYYKVVYYKAQTSLPLKTGIWSY